MLWFLIFTLLGVATVLGVGFLLGVTNARLKTRGLVVKHAREGLELQIQRRHEIVSAILDAIQRDGSFDLDSTDNVSFLAERARNTTKFTERGHFETALAESLKDLLAAVDNSPELSVNESYARPRQQLTEVEDDLRNAKRFYNDAVQEYNLIIDSIPNRVIGAMFSFSPQEPIEISSAIPESVTAIPETLVIPAPKSRNIMTAKKV